MPGGLLATPWPLVWRWTFQGLAVLVVQFDNPHVEPFDFFEGDQVYFTQEFDDLGLDCVHERNMAVTQRRFSV